MVTTTTRVAGTTWRSSRTASTPFSSGMVMSVTTMSGLRATAIRSSDRPSAACPTSSNSSRNRLPSPSATSAWSSASNTRERLGTLTPMW